MDELWQRYRAFWTPVLWGVGVFLIGLVVVHVATDDPEVGQQANERSASLLSRRTAANTAQIAAAKAGANALLEQVDTWAAKIDQRRGLDKDPYEAAVTQAYTAAILRGHRPADPAAFEGDPAAAAQANARCTSLINDRLSLLKSQDPNVSFSRVKADVVSELSVRANRADVDVNDEEFGLGAVQSVDRGDLPRRLLNLALVATIVDAAIREGVRSVDGVVLQPPEVRGGSGGPDAFLSEWPVKVDVTGQPAALEAILAVLTNPDAPTALGWTLWKTTGKKDGFVKGEFKAYSIRVNPKAVLGLESEQGE